jgi:hypothetical protein
MQKPKNTHPLILLAGDAAILLLVTLAGFARHGELSGAGLRLLSTFVPLCVAWALIAPWVGVYETTLSVDLRQVWRPPLAAFLAAPMAGWLRGLWLGADIIPVFVLVMAGFTGLGMLAWRAAWTLWARRQSPRQVSNG